MLYKFKSKAAGDLIMLGPNGDALMRVLGREPSAQGIIEPDQMVDAVLAIEKAVADEEAARIAQATQPAGDQADGEGQPAASHVASEVTSDAANDAVSVRQRLWPMVDMLRRAKAADEPVVWGV